MSTGAGKGQSEPQNSPASKSLVFFLFTIDKRELLITAA